MSIDRIDKLKCSGCYACSLICPKKCITMIKEYDGFFYPSVIQEECINCNLCEHVCPVLSFNGNSDVIKAYAAINKNDKSRMSSSSGGIFSALAEYVLERNGVIYGAAMADDCKSLSHIMVNNLDDLTKLKGSKYLQSTMDNIHESVKKNLESSKMVLFSGTPCQVAGLRKYLRREYENLFLIDIICHGVPSPELWKKYVEFNEKKNSPCYEWLTSAISKKHGKAMELERYMIQEKKYLIVKMMILFCVCF